jgi:hypothetical protein
VARLYRNFSSASVFSQAVQQMGATGGGEEATLDALHLLMSAQNPLALSWRAGSKHVLVMFTDEEPQTYLGLSLTPASINAEIATTSTKVYVFTDSIGQSTWAPVLPLGWGQLKALTTIAATMEQELTTIVSETSCR